ncbi:aldehyde dehydrogenase family protein [Dactylosporangium fulvum]
MTIGGRPTGSPTRFTVCNRATSAAVGHAPDYSDDRLDAAVRGAERAVLGWHGDEPARREALRASAERLRRHAEELAHLPTAEQGKAAAVVEGWRVARRPEARTVWLNSHGVVGPAQPHSAVRHSGPGIVGGGSLGWSGGTDLKVIAYAAPPRVATVGRS